MPSLFTTKFRHALAKQTAISGIYTHYYVAVGRPTSFPSDVNPPTPTDSVQDSHIDVYDGMIFGKELTGNDVCIMAYRNDWTSGTVYDAYDHENPRLYDRSTKFYVIVNEGLMYSVFKCLSNNNGSPSTVRPSMYETAADDDFYMTADGYQWKLLYTLPKPVFERFATTNYIPVIPDANVAANAVPGAIETIQVLDPGTRYNAYHKGTIQVARVNGNNQLYTIESTAASNTDFYKNSVIKITSGPGAGQQRVISDYIVTGSARRIFTAQPFDTNDLPTEESTYEISPNVVVEGDGSDFAGRALINAVSNTIHAIEITSKGSGYSWAKATVISNTGIINAASNTFVQANNAVLRVVISPPGGHGSEVESELGGTQLCISVTFNTVEAGGKLLPNNDFRTISVLKDPLFTRATIDISPIAGSFSPGEIILQPRESGVGTILNTGMIVSANSSQVVIASANGTFSPTSEDFGTHVFDGTEFTYGPVFNAANSALAVVTSVDPSNPGLYFDQTTTLIANLVSGTPFIQDEVLYQGDHANGVVYFANSSVIKLTNTKGVFNTAETDTSSGMVFGNTSLAAANTTAIKLPDLVKGSGEVIYIENISPIARTEGQSETIKVVLVF